MKIKQEYVVRKISNQFVVVPVGKSAKEFSGMIALNEAAAFIWNVLKEERTLEEVASAFYEEYETDEETSKTAVMEFVAELRKEGLLDE